MRMIIPSLAAVGLLAIAASTPAEARIQCQGNFQVGPYGLIATPYCEEEQIARVAQAYGWKVTATEIHRDPLKKVYVCQVLGYDNRLKGSCAGYGPENYAPGR
ncbi:hypothetical protein [Methyloceanibacter sp.]|uniref:hypothetical protein n=1 Tax=Methyloceanibacter sp. TaxID=1965321 RepID=UPI002D65D174|nr:hypothetical protein [Methyloceanibacter sp.]HZP08768.1 hypothetical protein [Methyloceanibacter sp.]